MTREEWLIKAVEKLNANLFNGELDLINHPFQIAPGRVLKYSAKGDVVLDNPFEVFLPYEGEDATMDDFYPPSIIINHAIKDPLDLLVAVALGCIQAFFKYPHVNQKFRKEAERFYFEFDKSTPIINDFLKSILMGVYGVMVKNYGEYPGKPIIKHKKEKEGNSERQKNTLNLFCSNPECNYELKISRKVYEKYGQKTPTCICGAKMAADLSDEEEENKEKLE